jgi:hypothetical protein
LVQYRQHSSDHHRRLNLQLLLLLPQYCLYRHYHRQMNLNQPFLYLRRHRRRQREI